MHEIVAGLVAKPLDAQTLIDDLMATCLCDREDVSVIGRDYHAPGATDAAARAVRTAASAAGGAAFNAATGVANVASAVISRPISGFGIVNAIGQIGVVLSNAALGSVNDLAKGFVEFGVSAELAREYAEALQGGKILVVVQAKTRNMASCARRVLEKHGAVPARAGTLT
jgi:hypothetical protein